MINLYNNSFAEYSMKKGIIYGDFNNENFNKKSINEDTVIGHIYALSEFHKKVMGYDNYINHRLEDKRGRTVEKYKIYIKKVSRQYELVKKKSELNNFENLLLKWGDEYLIRAKQSIDVAYDSGYIELLKRSMQRNEVCLGDVYFTNIRKSNMLEVNDLSKCCYDLVEMDGIRFFTELIENGIILNYKELIQKFCEVEKLDTKSERFIEALISYPYEFMKCCIRYDRKGEQTNEAKYVSRLKKIINKDFVNLL